MKSNEEEEDGLPKTIAFPWAIVAFLIGGLVGFMVAASAVPTSCFQH